VLTSSLSRRRRLPGRSTGSPPSLGPQTTPSAPAHGCRSHWRSWLPVRPPTPVSPLAALAAELRDTRSSLDAFTSAEARTDVRRAVFFLVLSATQPYGVPAVQAPRPAPRPRHLRTRCGQPHWYLAKGYAGEQGPDLFGVAGVVQQDQDLSVC
jgi:hypothetical protein